MSTTEHDRQLKPPQANSFYAALGHTMTRGAALYFSRPVRLFRPSKGKYIDYGRIFPDQ